MPPANTIRLCIFACTAIKLLKSRYYPHQGLLNVITYAGKLCLVLCVQNWEQLIRYLSSGLQITWCSNILLDYYTFNKTKIMLHTKSVSFFYNAQCIKLLWIPSASQDKVRGSSRLRWLDVAACAYPKLIWFIQQLQTLNKYQLKRMVPLIDMNFSISYLYNLKRYQWNV